MKASKRQQAKTSTPVMPQTWAETLEKCPFRSFVGLGPDVAGMRRAIAFTFVALGGEACPIAPERLAEMVDALRAGRSVLILSDRSDLRDFHKREILTAAHGAAGSA